MADYLFSYAYVINNVWQFDYLVYELPRFTHADMEKAQKDAARRHDKSERIYHIVIVPIAVSKLDSPNVRMKIVNTTNSKKVAKK